MLLLVGRERALLGSQDGGMGALATTDFSPSSKPVEVALASSLVSVDVITESYAIALIYACLVRMCGEVMGGMELHEAEEKEAEARQLRSVYVEQLQQQTARVLPSYILL